MPHRVPHRPDPLPWQFVARRRHAAGGRPRRTAALALALLLAACQPPPAEQAAAHVAAADRLAAAGDPAAAVDELRAGITLRPDDPGLRQRRAALLLETGDGGLAAVDLEAAIRLGASRESLLPDLAEALLLQGQPLEALDLLPAPAGRVTLPTVLRIRLASVESRSLLAVRNAPGEQVRASLLRLFELLDGAGPGDGERERRRVAALRTGNPAVEAAWQHHACRAATPVVYSAATAPGATPGAATGRVLRVGPGRDLASPAAAARAARDGDTVVFDPGTYPSGGALWPQSRLTLRGSSGEPGERPRILASARGIEDRDAWLLTGDDVRVENLEISGARAGTSRNGAAIRHMGRNLTLRNVYLHDNEDGLLTGDRAPDSRVLIEHSEFARNGYGDGLSHNIYVGKAAELTLRFSWSRESRSGQLVKSRARRNRILANRLTDGADGRGSYLIDLSEGGDALIAGNVLQKSHAGENPVFIVFAAEGAPHPVNALVVVHNTFWNSRYQATAVRNRSTSPALVANNILAGAPMLGLDGPGELVTNLRRAETGLRDPRALDFTLLPDSAAIDAGTPLESLAPPVPGPLAEYVHPLAGRDRLEVARPDLGAYEFCDPVALRSVGAASAATR
jgi:hypothetical protein